MYLVAFLLGRATGWDSLSPAKESAGNYYGAIDGLRGFLAISVFIHHAVIERIFATTGRWDAPQSNFYAQLGPFAVTMFFFVTGFLFWQKLIKSGGLPFLPFLLNRVRRLAPAYLAFVALSFLIVAIECKGQLSVTPSKLAAQAASWIVCGVPLGLRDFNGSLIYRINGGVAWSLRIEWGFYLILPFLAWYARRARVILWIGICAAVSYWGPLLMTEVHTRKAIGFAVDVAFFSAYCFSGGILASYIKGRRRLEAILRHWLCTPLAIGLWAVTMFAVRPGYGAAESALLVPIFLMIVSGNDFHGLLSSRAFSFLGTISYSVYLLHPIVLYVCTRAAGRVIDFRTVTPLAYWTLAAAIGMVVILVSSLSYRFIEYPAMAKPRQARATVAP